MLEIISIILKYKKLLIAVTLAAFAVSAIISLMITPVYKSTATILPIGFIRELADVRNYFSYLGSLGETFTSYARIKKNFIIHSILRSRRVSRIIINKFDLGGVYQIEDYELVREKLLENTTINITSSGSIFISFEDKNPERAAEVVEAYINALDSVILMVSINDAEAQSHFIKKEIEKRKRQIAKSDSALMAFMEQHGVYKLEDQARAALEVAAAMRARQEVIEIKKGILESMATEKNQQLKLIKLELEELDKQINEISIGGDDIKLFPPLANFPYLASEYVQMITRREMEEFALQYLRLKLEDAKISSARDFSSLRVIDPPFVPERRIWPKRKQIVLFSSASVLLWACVLVIAIEVWRRRNLDLDSIFTVGGGVPPSHERGEAPGEGGKDNFSGGNEVP
jgi:tyrosine-protein kinase Etk/Wzc